MVNSFQFCDKCRDKMTEKMELYKISFAKPSQNMAMSFLAIPTVFVVCKKCFFSVYNMVESNIVKGGKEL